MSQFDTMFRRPDAAPDEKRLVIEGTLQDKLVAALDKYLQQGAELVKSAGYKGRMTQQFKPGTANQPGATQPFFPYTTVDVNGTWGGMAPGAYIIRLSCETASVRYTLSGIPPSSTFGLLVLKNVFVDITVQDLSNLQVCATANGEIIDLEYYQIDA